VLNIRIVQEAQNRLFEFFVLVNRHQFVIEFVSVVQASRVNSDMTLTMRDGSPAVVAPPAFIREDLTLPLIRL